MHYHSARRLIGKPHLPRPCQSWTPHGEMQKLGHRRLIRRRGCLSTFRGSSLVCFELEWVNWPWEGKFRSGGTLGSEHTPRFVVPNRGSSCSAPGRPRSLGLGLAPTWRYIQADRMGLNANSLGDSMLKPSPDNPPKKIRAGSRNINTYLPIQDG